MARIGRPPSCECGECKKCKRRVRGREWYRQQSAEKRQEIIANRDPERVKANDRARYWRDKPKRRALMDEWAAENSDRATEAKRAWNERNPEKRQASIAVNNAVRGGRLKKEPCEVCGSPESQGHHDDYSKPLVVRWLCTAHHAEHHVKQRDLAVG